MGFALYYFLKQQALTYTFPKEIKISDYEKLIEDSTKRIILLFYKTS